MTVPYLLWLDLETTGIGPDDVILEVATILTHAERDFDEISRWEWVVRPDHAYRQMMDDFVIDMHTRSGLLDLVTHGTPISIVDINLAHHLGAVADRGKFMLAGSGVSHFDHNLVKRYMPRTAEFLKYATLDVGVIRRAFEYVGRHDLIQTEVTDATKAHRAMADIEDHLNEWRGYAPLLGGIALA